MRNKITLILFALLLSSFSLSASDWVTGNPECRDWSENYSQEENWTLRDSYGNQDWSTLPSDVVLEMIIGKNDKKLFAFDNDEDDDDNDDLNTGDSTTNEERGGANDVPVGDGVGIILLLIAVYILKRTKSNRINQLFKTMAPKSLSLRTLSSRGSLSLRA